MKTPSPAPRHLLLDTSNCLIVSDDPEHLVATIGCRDLVVIHTADATLICPADQAERIKELYKLVEERFGRRYVRLRCPWRGDASAAVLTQGRLRAYNGRVTCCRGVS